MKTSRVFISFVFCAMPSSFVFAQANDLTATINEINLKIIGQKLQVKPLTLASFKDWYQSLRQFKYNKADRSLIDQSLSSNQFPKGYVFTTENMSQDQLPDRLNFGHQDIQNGLIDQITVMDGKVLWTWENQYLSELANNPPAEDENQFTGTPPPDLANTDFPADVPVQIKEITLSINKYGESTHVPALDIQFQITKSNISGLAKYFGSGYSVELTVQNLNRLLGSEIQKWISIKDLFRGWPAQWANRFPAEMLDNSGNSGNDVCFGVSRQFFMDELSNGGLDRSMEATEFLLKNHYHLLQDIPTPAFGDYLYLPGQHAIRFIMQDPGSRRWIGFTAWSDSRTPYRLWWVDQDYSNPLIGAAPQNTNFPKTMDIWRKNSEK